MESTHWVTKVLFPYTNFFLFLGALIFFARKPLQAMVQKKRQDFLDLAEEAGAAKAEADRQEQEISKRLANLDAEILGLIEKAKRAAEEECQRILGEGKKAAIRIKEEAERNAQAEWQKAQEQLNQSLLIQLRLTLAAKLQNELSEAQQDRIMEQQFATLSELGVFAK